jgi:nucleoside-diphosphate-sugar epimerase
VTGAVFEPDDGREGGWPHGEFARAIGRAAGRRVLAPRVPAPLFTAAARLDRLLRGAGAKLTPDRARYMLHPDWACSPDRRVPATLWSPRIPTYEGLAATAAWYRAAGWL